MAQTKFVLLNTSKKNLKKHLLQRKKRKNSTNNHNRGKGNIYDTGNKGKTYQ